MCYCYSLEMVGYFFGTFWCLLVHCGSNKNVISPLENATQFPLENVWTLQCPLKMYDGSINELWKCINKCCNAPKQLSIQQFFTWQSLQTILDLLVRGKVTCGNAMELSRKYCGKRVNCIGGGGELSSAELWRLPLPGRTIAGWHEGRKMVHWDEWEKIYWKGRYFNF